MIRENGTLPAVFPGACFPLRGCPSNGREVTVPGRGVPAVLLPERGLRTLYEVGEPARGRR